MSIIAASRPNQDNHPISQKADRDDADFAVIAPVVCSLRNSAGKNLIGVFEIEPALPQSPVTFCGIVGNRHRLLNVYTRIDGRQGLALCHICATDSTAGTLRNFAQGSILPCRP
jgi:hypothetical protein